MTHTQFNIGVFGVGFLNLVLFHGDLGMNIFTTMIQVCLLVALWFTLARRRVAERHNYYIHNLWVMTYIGQEAATLRNAIQDTGMLDPGYAGIFARHIAERKYQNFYINLDLL